MKKIFALVLAVFASFVFAQDSIQLKVSTGSTTGTYNRMFNEFNSVCKDKIMMLSTTSTGSIQNMDRLIGNEVNAAIVQTDVLFFRARNEDLSNIKTLFSLHPEQVHVITMTTSPIVEGGVVGFGAKPIQLNAVESLAGRTVAAWGGSMVTAQVIRLQSEISYTVVQFEDFNHSMAALTTGKVAAVLMVGGQPLDDVKALGPNFKLLTFSPATIEKLKNVYRSDKINYSGMGSGGEGIMTVATDALFVTRSYKSPKIVNSLAALRQCFKDNVNELSETVGRHKAWSKVNTDNTGKWPYAELVVKK